MSASGVSIPPLRQRYGRLIAWARALPLAALLLLASLGCNLLETPEPSPQTAAPSLPTATAAPTQDPSPVQPTAPSGVGLVLQVAVAPTPGDLPDYDRGEWRHWTDENDDCQSARQEVLIAESMVPVSFESEDRCRVASGRWQGPYTGEVVEDPGKLDIDHMVPLANAHRSGGWTWDRDRKREYANSLVYDNHLIATTSAANRSKGAKGPEAWRPPLEDYWCAYAIDWITVKNNWQLTVTEAEYEALRDMLAACPMPALLQRTEGSRPSGATPEPASVPAATATPEPRATAPPGLRYDPFGPDRDCGDFDTYQEALDFFIAAGGPDEDPHGLDSNGDGKPCDSLPRAKYQGPSVMNTSGSSGSIAPVSPSQSPAQDPAIREATPTPVPAPAALPSPAPSPPPPAAATPTPVHVPVPTPAPAPKPASIPTPTTAPAATPAPLPTATLAPTPAPAPAEAATPAPAPAVPPAAAPAFSGLPHAPGGAGLSCGDFESWWEAQNFYYAAGGPDSDPHRLDADGDGVACVSLPGAPKPGSEPSGTEPSPVPPENAFVDRNCGDFDSWQEAQDFFLSEGGPDKDPHRLDRDGDGVACASLPGADDGDPEPSGPEPAPVPPEDAFADRNCGDFDSWQEAQDFFLSEGGPDKDPHRLDRDGDGVACASLPGAPKDDAGQPAPTPKPTPPEDAFVDRNCGDFDSWQEAQDFFLSEGGPDKDPHRLDRNGDGIACESLR